MSAPFKVGDLVRLKNPWGPVMTVKRAQYFAIDTPPLYHLVWFDAHSRLHEAEMCDEVLELVGAE